MSTSTNPQHELTGFLYAELLHSLGSYSVVVERLEALTRRIESTRDNAQWDILFPARVVGRTRDYNRALRDRLNLPSDGRRDYSTFQQTHRTAGSANSRPPRHPVPVVRLPGEPFQFDWIVDFYSTAIRALTAFGQASNTDDSELGQRLAHVYDPLRGAIEQNDFGKLANRIKRFEGRLNVARDNGALTPRADRASELLHEHLGTTEPGRLNSQLVAAVVEGHLLLHRVEHIQSHDFGDHIKFSREIHADARSDCEQSIILNTFVYAVARSLPWIFAEDDIERQAVLDDHLACYATLTPHYCMWIAAQYTLLALHRRGHAWRFLGDTGRAYRDFHKLKRLATNFDRALEESSLRAPGAHIFLQGLSALADHHTGRIYQAQHAHTVALRYFARAANRLERLSEDQDAQEVLVNSRWHIRLLIGQGDATYDLGMIKRPLLWYARAWHALLILANSETASQPNGAVVGAFIDWLTELIDEPEIDKVALSQRVAPLVSQINSFAGPRHLRLLAAEIVTRIGHMLLLLRLPSASQSGATPPRPSTSQSGVSREELARICLAKALALDERNTATMTDLLKIDYRNKQRGANGTNSALSPYDTVIARHAPRGGGDFETSAQVVDYVLQLWLNEAGTLSRAPQLQRARIAQELLAAYLYHTDHTNVKLAQVYRYLMQTSARHTAIAHAATTNAMPSMEFLCARRYSSFFPFLPRPSPFRVPGGGYFVQVRDVPDAEDSHAASDATYGIAIDPGPNFLHNLYSCGQSLDDIDVIIVTHDHADHLAAFDATLALLGYRAHLDEPGKFTATSKLLIVGNKSVVKRYKFYRRSRRDNVEVISFAKFSRATRGEAALENVRALPKCLELELVASVDHRDAAQSVSQAFVLRVGEGRRASSILFTGDTGLPPDLGGPAPEIKADGTPMSEAIRGASVVIAHISSVRLPELRQLGGLVNPPAGVKTAVDEFDRLWMEIASQSLSEDEESAARRSFLLRELQFAFNTVGAAGGMPLSPLANPDFLRKSRDRHLYLAGVLSIAETLRTREQGGLLLIGELREELGTFRTGIAASLNENLFNDRDDDNMKALTTDIGLRLRLDGGAAQVMCTTCDLDNDLVEGEMFHAPRDINELCVKGEDEGVFYTCRDHDRRAPQHQSWVERVERYDPFGRHDPFRP